MADEVRKGITFTEYAEMQGVGYETIRQKVERHRKKNADFINAHVFQVDGVNHLDETAVEYFNKTRRNNPVVIQDNVTTLNLRIEELEDALKKKNEEVQRYMERVIELQNNPKEIDSSKYMLIEDHKKIEEELERKNKEIESL